VNVGIAPQILMCSALSGGELQNLTNIFFYQNNKKI